MKIYRHLAVYLTIRAVFRGSLGRRLANIWIGKHIVRRLWIRPTWKGGWR